MCFKRLTKANIAGSGRGGGGVTLHAKLHVLKHLNSSSARSNVHISNLFKTYVFLYCLFYNVTINTVKYIYCLFKIYTVLFFISPVCLASRADDVVVHTDRWCCRLCSTQSSDKKKYYLYWSFMWCFFGPCQALLYFLLFLCENALRLAQFLSSVLRLLNY